MPFCGVSVRVSLVARVHAVFPNQLPSCNVLPPTYRGMCNDFASHRCKPNRVGPRILYGVDVASRRVASGCVGDVWRIEWLRKIEKFALGRVSTLDGIFMTECVKNIISFARVVGQAVSMSAHSNALDNAYTTACTMYLAVIKHFENAILSVVEYRKRSSLNKLSFVMYFSHGRI